jgi:signal transduction histidine kinase
MILSLPYSPLKMLLLGAFFSLSSFGFGKTHQDQRLLNDQVKLLSNEHRLPELKSILEFERRKHWDSILINSNKLLNKQITKQVVDYLHYYRGLAFLRKHVEHPAIKEFNAIDKAFPYYFKVEVLKGEIFLEKGQFDEALEAFLSIDTTDQFQLQHIKLIAILQNIGNCYFFKKEYKKAERYYLTALSKIESSNNPQGIIYFYIDLANLYYEQYKDKEAINYFQKAYQLANERGEYRLKMITSLNMAVIEENRGNYKESVRYHKEYEQWHDSVNDQNKIYEVAQKEKKFAVAQKQRQVKLLQTEYRLKQTERNLYLISSLALGIILVFGIILYRQNVKRSRIILLQKQELDELNSMKDRLFSIVSHDLRSSVYLLKDCNSALYTQLANGEVDKAMNQLERNTSVATNTYNLLDNLLHWALLQTKGGYFKMENHRLGMIVEQVAFNFQASLLENQLTFENHLPKTMKAYVDAELMKIVLRNLLDNSIKFSNPGGKVGIYPGEETSTSVQFIWKDTGRGMTEETRITLLSDTQKLTKKEHENEIGSGLGMNLCKSMILKNQGTLDIRSELGIGTEFIVTLQKKPVNGTAD